MKMQDSRNGTGHTVAGAQHIEPQTVGTERHVLQQFQAWGWKQFGIHLATLARFFLPGIVPHTPPPPGHPR